MKVSIVINTYNRAAYLEYLLPALGHLQTSAELEVVVVNGPSTDHTDYILSQYKDYIKIIQCPTRNLSSSRNLGINASSGDIIVFIDDDAFPLDNLWIERFVRAFDEVKDIGFATGPVLHRDSSLYEFKGGATTEYGFQLFKQLPEGKTGPDGKPYILGAVGCNVAFRSEILKKIGGFDEYFVYYLDETDVCLRMERAGYRGIYLPENGVRHYSAGSERRRNNYDRNWDVIARSDAYFAIKNSRDGLLSRIFNTLIYSSKKHFIVEIDQFKKNREISFLQWLRLRVKCLWGFVQGIYAGISLKRKFFTFSPPLPLKIFKMPKAEKTLRIGLLTQLIPEQQGCGGIGRYTYDLARGLHQRGHEVHVFYRGENEDKYKSLNFVLHGVKPETIEIDDYFKDKPVTKKNITYSLAIEKRIRELYYKGIEFDVIHASNWDLEALSLIRSRIFPVCLMLVTPLAQVVKTENWELNSDLMACIELDRYQIQNAEAVCVPSNGVLKSYRELMNINPDDLQLYLTPLGIIPRCVDLYKDLRRHKKILFVGRLEYRKGIHILLDALPEVLELYDDWECHIVGDDHIIINSEGKTFRSIFEERYRGCSWIKRVFFHGNVSEQDLYKHYQECDLFVAPSLFESFGLILQEAMQFGKAVIGSATGGMSEVVSHDHDGYLVPPGDVDSLKKAMKLLMKDEQKRLQLGKNAFNRIRNEQNYLTMAKCLEEVYLKVYEESREKYLNVRSLNLPPVRKMVPIPEGVIAENWEVRNYNGSDYLVGNIGSKIYLRVKTGSTIFLKALNHSYSGAISIQFGKEKEFEVLDFYETFLCEEKEFFISVIMNFERELYYTDVEIHVLNIKNPKSNGYEIWLKEIGYVGVE